MYYILSSCVNCNNTEVEESVQAFKTNFVLLNKMVVDEGEMVGVCGLFLSTHYGTVMNVFWVQRFAASCRSLYLH